MKPGLCFGSKSSDALLLRCSDAEVGQDRTSGVDRPTQFVKWEVYREGERVADGLSFTVYRTGRSPSVKATCVGEATTFRERLFP